MTGTKGIVASGHEATSAAGRQVLEAGGNAFDAVLGALCASMVCEPLLTSLAGGGFLLARPAHRPPEVFDFFVQTPAVKRPAGELDFHPVLADFGPATQEFHVGLGAAAVPGTAAGILEVHAALGELPLREVLAPAVELARRGVVVTPYQAHLSTVLRSIVSLSPEATALIAPEPLADDPEDLRPAVAGETIRNPELADAFEALAREGARWFYAGEPARKLVADCRERGGMLTLEDLDRYRVLRRRPVHTRAFGAEFWLNAPPSPGGSLVAFALALLEPLPLRSAAWDAPESRLAVVRAMEAANRLRSHTVMDRLDEALAAELLAEDSLASWRDEVHGSDRFSRGTTHLSVADEHGNLASLTSSNGEGCGYVIPGTGVMLNNMLGEEDLNPDGFHRWTPDVRLASMMCPTLARLADGGEVALGTGGSNRIRGAVLQVLLNLCAFGLPLQRAVEAPRLHLEGTQLSVEAGLPAASREALAAYARDEEWPDPEWWPEPSLFFGGVHAAERLTDGGFRGAGDFRRRGAVAVSDG